MSFRITKKENTNFSTPQEMYTDYKRRKINGPLDYQSDMIDLYMKKAYTQSDVALELPTGSGKTLIGLLIGEFRRRKNKEKVVYVCPNNQLVYQTVEKARDSYGIKVNGFTGKIKNYDPAAKADYNTAQAISITNYSSLFLNNSFFSDADIIIMDDAHSAEGFIVSSWSLEIKRSESKDLYLNLLETIKDKLEITQYNRMNSTQPMYEDLVWFDKLPNIKMIEKQQAICDIVDEYVKETDLRYPWANIKDHLHACNIFLSWNAIVIRPYIPPALTHPSMVNSKQRIYMSATLGESGELERITGVPNIFRLPMVRDWDKRGIGRRFFIFPNASFKSEFDSEILKKINNMVNRSLLLTQDDKTVRKVAGFFKTNTSKEVFLSKDIEHSKEGFIKSENGIAILANRFDGIDLLDDECRLLIIANLPSATHLQEKFLTNRMAASVLFNERIKTRLVQAVGRCTRSHVDYAAVCIFGQELENSLVSPNKLVQFHPELQAEIEFGYEQSISHNSIDDFLKLLKLFYERKEAWEEAEEDIINRRDSIIERQEKNQKNSNFDKLLNSSKYEVKFQYALWKKDFEGALNEIEHILALLDSKELKGYKGFWNYIAGYVSYQIYLQGKESFLGVSKDYMKTASTSTNSITWFNQLVEKNSVKEETVNYYVSDVLEKIEQ
ncbi:DEAD/DEAH box helicase family protein, partial [Paenibacillus chitinolyticus]|uniref:DEAD/DEAH box helicase family protein n=1 Tax=Paenibacillus chitinolyticus TaxID=79263 RepID=UPI00366C7A1C